MQERNTKNNSLECDLMGITIMQVNGTSMLPELFNCDTLVVNRRVAYMVGEIIAFDYLDEGILVHRLLKIVGNQYYCKGDNSFRLERITKSNIIGKVTNVIRNHQIIPVNVIDPKFVNMSYEISRLFLRSKYNRNAVIQSDLYKKYYLEYLSKNSTSAKKSID